MRITFQLSSSHAVAPETTILGAELFNLNTRRAALLQIAQRSVIYQQIRETIGKESGTPAWRLTRRVNCGPTQRSCTLREKKPLSH
ncbi:Uncharacterised protein [Citrobacter amalonaticus]|nr:Uncharacterised protein [Citrobacter amalonaticus]